MLLDSQNQFREDYAKSLRSENAAALPAADQELCKEWIEKNHNILYKLSDEELVQSFSDYRQAAIKEQINELIENSQFGEPEKQRLRQFAARGQVILASTDGGNTFDKLITPDDLDKVENQNYELLSSTFLTIATNVNELRKVIDEQTLLNVAANLRAQSFTIQSASIDKNRVIHMDLVPRGEIAKLDVDLTTEVTEPLIYDFIDAEGKEVKKLEETQLPEEFGEIEGDPSLKMPSLKEMAIQGLMDDGAGKRAGLTLAAQVALGAAANEINAANARNAANLAAIEQEEAERAQAAPLIASQFAQTAFDQVPDVMASKATVKARTELQKQALTDQRESYKQRLAKRDEELKEKQKERKRREEDARSEGKKQTKKLLAGGAIGAGMAGAASSAIGGLTMFINHINNLF